MQEVEAARNFASVEVVWEPGKDSGQRTKQLMKTIQEKYKVEIKDFWDLHQWSVNNIPSFWEEIWKISGIIHSKPYEQVVDLTIPIDESPEWFKGCRINYAENLLRYRDDHVAIIAAGEERETKMITYAQMYAEVKPYSAALRKFGLKKGDRVACIMSNREEAVFAMLATASIGAIWLGTLPLMGTQAVLNRFEQVSPRVLFTIDRFPHNKEERNLLPILKEIAEGLPTLEKVVIVPSKKESKEKDISHIRNSCFLDDFLELGRGDDGSFPDITFEQMSLSSPLFINYTSGTTGLPKALVHSAGLLFGALREFWLHNDDDRNNVWLSMSPVGWATWNMVSTFHFLGSTVLLFEGLPYFLSPTFLWDMVDKFGITNLFLTPTMLDELEKKGYIPNKNHHLTSLKCIMSGGSVVKPQNYDFVYKKIKPDVIFGPTFGITELIGCCMVVDRTLRIHKGELPTASLGVEIQCLDDDGKEVLGEVGNLVISKPVLTLPLGLWGDSDGKRFKKTYFSQFPGKFALGDLGIINPVTKGIIICGRADDTLKPRGCRFGSSEIYNIVDTFLEVRDSLCVSQFNKDRDERAVLFLKMRSGHQFSDSLVKRIRETIAKELSIRHVPEVILEIPEIPYNLNGKKLEIIVKKIINNMAYNSETVVNPESLKYYKDIPELQGSWV